MEAENRVFVKCAWRLIPLIVLLFTVNFLDRVNVGFAALSMNKDLGFSPAVFGFGAGVFFAGYFAFEVPSNLALARVGARRWIALITFLWGIASAACAFVEGPASFYGLRFLLGAAEAGFFPGVLFYLTLWFPQSYRARFAACIIAAGPIANIIGGPLSGFILGMDGVLGLQGWQWLFIIEGLPASTLAYVVLRFMPDRPENAAWLSNDEKKIIAVRMAADFRNVEYHFRTALRDVRVLLLSLVAVCIQSGLFGIGFWLPQIIQAMGFSPLATGFIVVPPYLIAAIAVIAVGLSSDRRKERVWHLAVPAFVAASGLIAASMAQNNLAVLIALGFGVAGVLSTFGPFWGIPTSFLGDRAAAGGIALINAIGSLGGFFTPTLIGLFRQFSGDYKSGMALMAAEMLAAGLIVISLRGALPSPKAQA